MRWAAHIAVGAGLAAAVNPLTIPAAVVGATAPDFSQLPIRQFTLFCVFLDIQRVSQLPIRQFTATALLTSVMLISQLPIRQFTMHRHGLHGLAVSQLPIRQFTWP